MSNSNKTTKVAKAVSFEAETTIVLERLNALSDERSMWEGNVYRTATEALYSLLSKTYAAYEDHFVGSKDEPRKAFRAALIQKLVNDGIRIQKTSTTLGILIRYVFKSDRKRVMRSAMSLKQQNLIKSAQPNCRSGSPKWGVSMARVSSSP